MNSIPRVKAFFFQFFSFRLLYFFSFRRGFRRGFREVCTACIVLTLLVNTRRVSYNDFLAT